MTAAARRQTHNIKAKHLRLAGVLVKSELGLNACPRLCDAVSWLNLDILTQPGSGLFGRLFRFPLSSHWTWDKIATQVPNRLNHLCAWMPLFSRAISRISHGDLATRPDWRHVVSAFPSRVRNDVWIGRRFESSKHLSSSFRRSSQSVAPFLLPPPIH